MRSFTPEPVCQPGIAGSTEADFFIKVYTLRCRCGVCNPYLHSPSRRDAPFGRGRLAAGGSTRPSPSLRVQSRIDPFTHLVSLLLAEADWPAATQPEPPWRSRPRGPPRSPGGCPPSSVKAMSYSVPRATSPSSRGVSNLRSVVAGTNSGDLWGLQARTRGLRSAGDACADPRRPRSRHLRDTHSARVGVRAGDHERVRNGGGQLDWWWRVIDGLRGRFRGQR